MQLLDGKKVSEDIKNEIAAEVQKMKANGEKVPHLAAIIVGNDGASLTYVGSKVKACERVGFESTLIQMPNTTSETELLIKIKELNNDDNIDGYIVQYPIYIKRNIFFYNRNLFFFCFMQNIAQLKSQTFFCHL